MSTTPRPPQHSVQSKPRRDRGRAHFEQLAFHAARFLFESASIDLSTKSARPQSGSRSPAPASQTILSTFLRLCESPRKLLGHLPGEGQPIFQTRANRSSWRRCASTRSQTSTGSGCQSLPTIIRRNSTCQSGCKASNCLKSLKSLTVKLMEPIPRTAADTFRQYPHFSILAEPLWLAVFIRPPGSPLRLAALVRSADSAPCAPSGSPLWFAPN